MPRYTEKTEISYDDYLRLEGLLTLARDARAQLEAIEQSVRGIMEETDDLNGHSGDAVWSGYTAQQLLQKSDVVILSPEPNP